MKVWRIVIDVRHHHRHAGRTGERSGLSAVHRHHQQLITRSCLSIKPRTGDDQTCRRVYGELTVPTAETVTVNQTQNKPKEMMVQKTPFYLTDPMIPVYCELKHM